MPNQPLRQSTAVTIRVGPCLDSLGANYSGLVASDIELTKNGTKTLLSAISGATITYDNNGFYYIAGTNSALSDTVGRLVISCGKDTYLMVDKFVVLPSTTFDATVATAWNASGGGGDVQRINGVQTTNVTTIAAVQGQDNKIATDASGRVNSFLVGILTSTFTETSLGLIAACFKQFFNIASPTSTANRITLVDTSTALTTLPPVPTDWLTAAGVKADAVTKIQAGLSTYAGGDTSGTTTLLTRLTSTRAGLLDFLDAAISSRMATFSYTTPPTSTAITTAIMTDLLSTSDFNTSGSFGKLIKDYLDAQVSTRLATSGYTAPPTAAQNRQEMDANSTKLATLTTGVNATQFAGVSTTGILTSTGVYATAALANAPSGSTTAPTTAQIAAALFVDGGTNKLKVNSDNSVNAASSGGGTGSYNVTITVNDGTTVLQNATVTLTINSSRYYAVTNASGVAVVTPNEGNGTYGVQLTCGGYQFTPTTLTVSGNTSHTYSMTQNSITPPSTGTTTGYAYTYDATGTNIVTGVTFSYSMLEFPSGVTGVIPSSSSLTATSDSNGRLLLTGLLPSTGFVLTNTVTGASLTFTTPASGTFAINGGVL
jgi:hypothetical protein